MIGRHTFRAGFHEAAASFIERHILSGLSMYGLLHRHEVSSTGTDHDQHVLFHVVSAEQNTYPQCTGD
jgi:hypothetical protein